MWRIFYYFFVTEMFALRTLSLGFMVNSPVSRFTVTGESTILRIQQNDQTYSVIQIDWDLITLYDLTGGTSWLTGSFCRNIGLVDSPWSVKQRAGESATIITNVLIFLKAHQCFLGLFAAEIFDKFDQSLCFVALWNHTNLEWFDLAQH